MPYYHGIICTINIYLKQRTAVTLKILHYIKIISSFQYLYLYYNSYYVAAPKGLCLCAPGTNSLFTGNVRRNEEEYCIMDENNVGKGIEKRRYKRLKIDLKLNVSNLFKQNNVNIRNIDSPITVTDISKSGIGFRSKSILPIDFYFNAALKLGSEEDVIYCVIKIIRCQPLDNSDLYAYGCEFVGLAPILNYIFDEYELELEHAETGNDKGAVEAAL